MSGGNSTSAAEGAPLPEPPSALTYKFLAEAFLMPTVSAFGLAGNSLSVYILSRREVKLKRDFVEILCSLATFDNLLLVSGG